MPLVSRAPERRLARIAAPSMPMAVCALALVPARGRLTGLILAAMPVEMMIRGVESLALGLER